MITPLNKTLIRKLTIERHGSPAWRLVIYLQPNGTVVFRKHRGRKRYQISVVELADRAMSRGPAEGLFELLLDEKSKPQSRKARRTSRQAPSRS